MYEENGGPEDNERYSLTWNDGWVEISDGKEVVFQGTNLDAKKVFAVLYLYFGKKQARTIMKKVSKIHAL